MKERYYLIQKLRELVEDMNKNVSCVIVEGKNDKIVLEKLGFHKKIFYPFEKIERKFVILTDFDKEGKKLAKELEKKFGEKNLEKSYRKKFEEILREYGIRRIEEIGKSLKLLEEL